MELSKGASTAIIVAVVIVVVAMGYWYFVKPASTGVSDNTRQKYMEMMKSGGNSGGSARPGPGSPSSGGMSGGMSGGGMSGGR
jgi:uncharacterized membrane protein